MALEQERRISVLDSISMFFQDLKRKIFQRLFLKIQTEPYDIGSAKRKFYALRHCKLYRVHTLFCEKKFPGLFLDSV